jgi:N-methylhydantoinase A
LRVSLRTHAVDIDTIGAGGGSIASVELGGVLKVGPQSAGAEPGPACYGRGGTEPTLTDALVVLGHLNPTALLDGAMPIAGASAREAVVTRIALPLGMSEIEAAWGILRVLATNVMVAMRTITVERGYDPREFPAAVRRHGSRHRRHHRRRARDCEFSYRVTPAPSVPTECS